MPGYCLATARVCFLVALWSILGGLLGLKVVLARMAAQREQAGAQLDLLMFTTAPQATSLRPTAGSVPDARAEPVFRAGARDEPMPGR